MEPFDQNQRPDNIVHNTVIIHIQLNLILILLFYYILFRLQSTDLIMTSLW